MLLLGLHLLVLMSVLLCIGHVAPFLSASCVIHQILAGVVFEVQVLLCACVSSVGVIPRGILGQIFLAGELLVGELGGILVI